MSPKKGSVAWPRDVNDVYKRRLRAGKTYRFVALVCPACPATFTLADLGAKTYDQVTKPAPAGVDHRDARRHTVSDSGASSVECKRREDRRRAADRRAGVEPGGRVVAGRSGSSRIDFPSAWDAAAAILGHDHECDVRPGTVSIRTVRVGAGPAGGRSGGQAVRVDRPLLWVKTTDPGNVAAVRNWSIDYFEALHPYSAGGAYVNMMMDEGQDRVRASYRENYDRLARIKAQYDPENLFRVNQNIQPAA